MKLPVAVISLVILMACSSEKKSEAPAPPPQTPVIRADTSRAVDSSLQKGDSTMARDTARR